MSLAVPGAVADADGGIAHFGNPLTEQRLFDCASGIGYLAAVGVVTVSGPDRLEWLHVLTSAALVNLAPGVSGETLVLSPHGRIEYAAAVLDDGSTTWLLAERAGELAAWLDTMRFAKRVEVTDRSEALAVVACRTGVPGAHLTWVDPWPQVLPGGVSYSGEPHPGQGWTQTWNVVDRADLAALLAPSPVGSLALEALRIGVGRPRFGTEVDQRTIPHELDWLRTAVHLHKGCYRGQETIARVHNLGRPPRRLVLLNLDGSPNHLPARGDAVTWQGRPVGAVTSVGYHYQLGPLALALIKRATGTEDLIVVGSEQVAASQTLLVGQSGVTASRPAPRPQLAKLERKSLL